MPQKNYISHYKFLKNKWSSDQKTIKNVLWEKHEDAMHFFHNTSKHLIAGSMSGLVLLTNPLASAVVSDHTKVETPFVPIQERRSELITDLSYVLPPKVRELSEAQEKILEQTLTRHFNIPIAATLQGKRLNRTYGYIGAEQHLARYPGDTMSSHFENPDDANRYYSSGMAPGLGAWRYFAPSASEMTEKDSMREKYYIAVQTFLAPGFRDNVREYVDFFKYRKMLVVNPENGKSVVAVIGDAGPAAWTGKHLGGSPEVMYYLERVDGRAKGPVLYFFIDDPEDTIPLGPIHTQ